MTAISNNGRFIRSSNSRPCPICGRIKDGDCCWNDDVFLCHTHVDDDAEIPGYVYRGATKDGMWGQYFPKPPEVIQKPVKPPSQKPYYYQDGSGQPLVRVMRTDKGDGSKTFPQSHWNGSKYITRLTDEVKKKIHLYRIQSSINQDAIAYGKPILIVEGEGKVDKLHLLGIAATCSIGGAGKWRGYGYPNYLKDLEGAKVVLCPDRDIPGVKHCEDIAQDFPDAQWLYPFPDSPLWNPLPKNGGIDIADWIDDGATYEQIMDAIGSRRELTSQAVVPDKEPKSKTTADLLMAIASNAIYFHTPDKIAYADITLDEHRETYPINSKQFKEWLRFSLYKRYEKTVGSETLNSVLGALEGKAKYEGKEQPVYLRFALYQGKIYLDLGDADWKAVEIDSDGWRITSDYPVRFRRPKGMLPLCMPGRDGDISELKRVLNLADESWTLILSWLSFCFYPNHPHPILLLHGEQGSGKSFTAQSLKSLIDPGKAPLQPEPKELQDLSIAANNRWVLCFDNLSNISNSMSDALCRIATGGGFATRTLYENDEETIFEFLRPIILTGIDSLATRSDLLERSILINLPSIPEENRLTEDELRTKFEHIKPRVLGAILNAVSQTLKTLPNTNPKQLPRMADFAKWAIASETALGLAPGSFLSVYSDNRATAHETALESSPVAVAIQNLMKERQFWTGTAAELLTEVENLTPEKTIKSRHWSSSPIHLSKILTRLAPDLRAIGIDITPKKIKGRKMIELRK